MRDDDEGGRRAQRDPVRERFINEVVLPELAHFGELATKLCNTQRKERTDRERFKFMLMLAAQFFEAVGQPREVAGEYARLARMPEDLDAGKVHSALEPTRVIGPPDAIDDWIARSNISLGIEAVMACSYSRESAAKYVSRHIGDAIKTVRKSSSGAPWRNIRDWHAEFAKGSSVSDFAQDNFTKHAPEIRAKISALPEDQRLAAATRILRAVSAKVIYDKPGPLSEDFSE